MTDRLTPKVSDPLYAWKLLGISLLITIPIFVGIVGICVWLGS